MYRTAEQLRDDLLAIWNAAVNGVRVDRLMRNTISLGKDSLVIDGQSESLDSFERIVILGGGKASGAMAETLESLLEPIAGITLNNKQEVTCGIKNCRF
jgi:glycerate-2-kinase